MRGCDLMAIPWRTQRRSGFVRWQRALWMDGAPPDRGSYRRTALNFLQSLARAHSTDLRRRARFAPVGGRGRAISASSLIEIAGLFTEWCTEDTER